MSRVLRRRSRGFLLTAIAVSLLFLILAIAFAFEEQRGRLNSVYAELGRSFALIPAALAKSNGNGGGDNGNGNGNGAGNGHGHGKSGGDGSNGNAGGQDGSSDSSSSSGGGGPGGSSSGGDGSGGSGSGGDGSGGDGSGGTGSGGGSSGGAGSGSNTSSSSTSGGGSPGANPGGSAAALRMAPDSTGTALGRPRSGGRGEFLPSEIVVVDDRPGIRGRALSLGFTIIDERRLGTLGLAVLRLRLPAGVTPPQGLAALHRVLPQLTADVETLYRPYATPAGQVATQPMSLPAADYAQRMIGWPQDATCGGGLRLGMIDTAVAAGLPALAGRKLHHKAFVTSDADKAEARHGTAIASLLVGRGAPWHPHWRGLLPHADLYAASVFERHGDRIAASAIAIASALDWLAANHVPVVNVSVSGEANALVALAVRRAAMRGTILVAAAGNGGPAAPPAYPAAYPDVIAVTAIDQRAVVFPEANRGAYIAFAAPGVRIWTPGENAFGRYETGTSFAAPFLAATVALEIAELGRADPDLLKRRLADHSIHLGPPGRNPIYGYGLPKVGASCTPVTAAAP
jgi:Subtilase family